MKKIRIKATKVSFNHERQVLIQVLENVKAFSDKGIRKDKLVYQTVEKCQY